MSSHCSKFRQLAVGLRQKKKMFGRGNFAKIVSNKIKNCRIAHHIFVFNFLGEMGGYMGLFLGASVITLFELFDTILCHLADNVGRKTWPVNSYSNG